MMEIGINMSKEKKGDIIVSVKDVIIKLYEIIEEITLKIQVWYRYMHVVFILGQKVAGSIMEHPKSASQQKKKKIKTKIG